MLFSLNLAVIMTAVSLLRLYRKAILHSVRTPLSVLVNDLEFLKSKGIPDIERPLEKCRVISALFEEKTSHDELDYTLHQPDNLKLEVVNRCAKIAELYLVNTTFQTENTSKHVRSVIVGTLKYIEGDQKCRFETLSDFIHRMFQAENIEAIFFDAMLLDIGGKFLGYVDGDSVRLTVDLS